MLHAIRESGAHGLGLREPWYTDKSTPLMLSAKFHALREGALYWGVPQESMLHEGIDLP